MSVYFTRREIWQAAHENERDGIRSILDRFVRSVARKWKRRKAISELHTLSDRELADIGICRADIPRLVDRLDDRDLGLAPTASAERSMDRRAQNMQMGDGNAVSA